MKTLKTETRRIRRYTEIAAILVLFTMCCHVDVRAKGKPVKPPRVGPAPEVEESICPKGTFLKRLQRVVHREGLAASKPGRSPAPWTVVRESAHQTPIFLEINIRKERLAKSAAGVGPERRFFSSSLTTKALFPPARSVIGTRTPGHTRGPDGTEACSVGSALSGRAGLGRLHRRALERGTGALRDQRPLPAVAGLHIAGRAVHNARGGGRPGGRGPEAAYVRQDPQHPNAELLDYDGPDGELYLWSATTEDRLRLTWCLEIRRIYTSAGGTSLMPIRGKILERYQASPSDGPAVGSGVDLHGNTVDLHTYEEDGLFTLIDGSREGLRS